MHTIEGATTGEVWISCLKAVLHAGSRVPDQKGWLRELSPVYLAILAPTAEDPLVARYSDPATHQFMEQNFCDPSPLTGWGFSYAGRLYHYRGVNQVDAIIRRLREHPAAKSATLCLLDPAGDVQHTPCLVALDWKIREGRLCLHAFFRSQDVGRKLTADAGELLRLSRQIAAALSLTDVRLYLSLASAHLYEADLPWLRAILNDHTP